MSTGRRPTGDLTRHRRAPPLNKFERLRHQVADPQRHAVMNQRSPALALGRSVRISLMPTLLSASTHRIGAVAYFSVSCGGHVSPINAHRRTAESNGMRTVEDSEHHRLTVRGFSGLSP